MNDKENRSNRIKVLKMNSKRKLICKNFSDIINDLEPESFISVEDTILMSKRVYEKIDTIANQETMNQDIELNINKVYSLRDEFKNYFDENAVLFHHDDRECGAIKIKVRDFFKNLDSLANFTKFKNGRRDLILVDENLKYGICIERYEYFNSLITWK